MAKIKISFEYIRCIDPHNWWTDDVYYLSTLECQPERRDLDGARQTITADKVQKISKTLQFTKNDRKTFPDSDNVIFEGDCPPSHFVNGAVYLTKADGARDLERTARYRTTSFKPFKVMSQRNKNLTAGAIGFIAGNIVLFLLLTGLPAGLGFFTGLLQVSGPAVAVTIGATGLVLVTYRIIELIVDFTGINSDDLLGSIPVRVPVSGAARELLPVGSGPFILNDDDADLFVNEVLSPQQQAAGRTARFKQFGKSGGKEYHVVLLVEREPSEDS